MENDHFERPQQQNEVSPRAGNGFPYIKELDIEIDIDTIVLEDFVDLHDLIRLSFKSTALRELTSMVFSPLKNLTHLNISIEKLERLDASALGCLSKLETLSTFKRSYQFKSDRERTETAALLEAECEFSRKLRQKSKENPLEKKEEEEKKANLQTSINERMVDMEDKIDKLQNMFLSFKTNLRAAME